MHTQRRKGSYLLKYKISVNSLPVFSYHFFFDLLNLFAVCKLCVLNHFKGCEFKVSFSFKRRKKPCQLNHKPPDETAHCGQSASFESDGVKQLF